MEIPSVICDFHENEMAYEALLIEWNLCSYVDAFQDEGIDDESFYLLDEETIRKIFPKSGPRLTFKSKYHKYLREKQQCPNYSVVCSLSNETVSETVSTASTDTVSSQAMDSIESASELLHSFERPARGPTTNLSLPTSPKVSKLDSRLDLIDSPFLEGLEALLKKTAEGKILLNSRGKLTSIQRQKLTNICFNELMGIYGDELSVAVLLKAAKGIPSIFALENSDTYMIPSQEGGPKGKLWHRYHNMRKAINLVNNHKKKCKDNKENESENSGTDAVEVSRYIDFLRVATEPLVKITEAWEATVKIRKNLYLNKTVSDIFKDFPCLKLDSGIQLIEMDFNLRHGDQMDIIYTTFPKVRDAILEEVKERKISYDLQFEDQNLLAIVSLVYLFPPITLKKSRKGENWRPTRSEIMESYFMQVDTFEEFQERLAKRRDKLLEHKLTQQPFALVVGGSQFYIQVEDKSYKVESALRTLELLFKAFFALEVSYPCECEHIWLLIEELLFGMKPKKKHPSSASVISDLKYYLEKKD